MYKNSLQIIHLEQSKQITRNIEPEWSSIHPPIHPSIHPSIHLSIHLSIHQESSVSPIFSRIINEGEWYIERYLRQKISGSSRKCVGSWSGGRTPSSTERLNSWRIEEATRRIPRTRKGFPTRRGGHFSSPRLDSISREMLLPLSRKKH